MCVQWCEGELWHARANMGHEWRLLFGGSLLTASTIGESPSHVENVFD
jgi:hypothetical protein